jgi:hypothetical protein
MVKGRRGFGIGDSKLTVCTDIAQLTPRQPMKTMERLPNELIDRILQIFCRSFQ